MNEKAEKFARMLAKMPDEEIFEVREVEDSAEHLVLFRSSLEAREGLFLPMLVFLDDTLYTIIRVWTLTDVMTDENRDRVRDYLMRMNREYKVFKYYDTEEGDIVLDACIPSDAEHFEPEGVAVVIDVVWDHLKATYAKLEAVVKGES